MHRPDDENMRLRPGAIEQEPKSDTGAGLANRDARCGSDIESPSSLVPFMITLHGSAHDVHIIFTFRVFYLIVRKFSLADQAA
jgi:hypothetical protein